MAVILPIVTKVDSSGLKAAQKGFGALKTQFDHLTEGFGLEEIGKKLLESAKLASIDQKAFGLLSMQMKRNAHATDEQVKSTEELLTSLAKQDGIVKTELYPAMTKLTNATHNVHAAQKLMKIALDASAVSGKPLNAVSLALAKAYNGNTTALTRMFPELKKSKDAIGDLNAEVQGAAAKKADPFAKFKVTMEELQISIGKNILPLLVQMMNVLSNPAILNTVLAIGALVGIMKVWEGVQAAINTLMTIFTAVMDANPIGLIALAVAGLIAGIVYLATQTTFFQDTWSVMTKVFKVSVDFMVNAWDAVAHGFKVAFDWITSMFKGYANGWIFVFESVINLIVNGLNAFLTSGNGVLGPLGDAIHLNLRLGGIPNVKLPRLAEGGIVPATPGGRQVLVGEGGSAEAIIPLNKSGLMGNTTVNVYVQSADPKAVIAAIGRWTKTNGKIPQAWTH
jgi:hypothetical protein